MAALEMFSMLNLKVTLVFLLLSLAALTAFKCSKSDDELQSKINDLEFRLVTLDELGNEKSVFEVNTNITLALSANNKSGHIFICECDYRCQLTQISDFLLVYRKITNDKGDLDQVEPIGRPYLFPSYCPTLNLRRDTIPPGISIAIGAAWSNVPENKPLERGKYFTGIRGTININGHQKKMDSRTYFEIK
jgi:hypothetical protein